jgi:hypothetical protein
VRVEFDADRPDDRPPQTEPAPIAAPALMVEIKDAIRLCRLARRRSGSRRS